MFLFIATTTAALFAADPDTDPGDIYARLGCPKMESCEYRIHVGEDGRWTIHVIQTAGIKGVSSEDLDDFSKTLVEEAAEIGIQGSTHIEVRDHRLRFESRGKSNDPLNLALLLVHVCGDDRCDFLRWDREAFEWKYLRANDRSSSQSEHKTLSESAFSLALGIFLTAVLDDELRKKGVTQAELESAAHELMKCRLVLTTDGKITADLPAEVSDDGKKMTLDLSKFVSDPPEQWSLRIVGL